MKIIKVLPEGLIDRIAAGEVIENPASVVKELVENSIDAGARNIEIAITGGGKEEIAVIDDGEGIPKDQVELAFSRHATSKIRSWDDLLRASSMGFRGEALPSISSVSIMELTCYYEGEKTGTCIRFEGGKQVFLGPAPPRKGCAISVRNLFYNVPARRKFLKSETAERRKIAEVTRRYVIAHPAIGFKIHYDGRLASLLSATENLLSRLESVWGDGITGSLVKLDEPRIGPLEIKGYVSKPESTRANRSEVFFFVNKRPVLERAMFGAIAASYGHALPPGRHPYAAVFLDIDPGFVDINVHPAKTEVRFADDGFIFSTLKRALDKALSIPVGFQFTQPASLPVVESPKSFETAKQELLARMDSTLTLPRVMGDQPINAKQSITAHETAYSSGGESFLQLFDTYILARREGELHIIDQHTAHERILFEKTLSGLDRHGSASQRLLFEERVKLTPGEIALLEEISELLTRAGFELRPFGPDEVIVSGLPQDMAGVSPQDALREVLAIYSANLKEGQEVRKALAAAIACKAAVKAGQRLSEPQMKGLYQELFTCREPYRCPHGRPTIATMSRDDLERIFKRK